jgi:hypothetical protein
VGEREVAMGKEEEGGARHGGAGTTHLFFSKKDMMIHHLLVLSFFAAIHIHQYPDEYIVNFTNQLIKFEYSTILYSGGPLVLHYLSQKKQSNFDIQKWMPVIRNAFHVGFAVLFLKYRIYDFSTKIIFNEKTYFLNNFQNKFAFIHLIGTTWAFTALNIYWLQLIILKPRGPCSPHLLNKGFRYEISAKSRNAGWRRHRH